MSTDFKFNKQLGLLNWPYYGCPDCAWWMSSDLAEFAYDAYKALRLKGIVEYEDLLERILKE